MNPSCWNSMDGLASLRANSPIRSHSPCDMLTEATGRMNVSSSARCVRSETSMAAIACRTASRSDADAEAAQAAIDSSAAMSRPAICPCWSFIRATCRPQAGARWVKASHSSTSSVRWW